MHTPQWIAFGLCGLLWLPQAAAQLHHDLDVSLQPGSGSIEVLDTITLEDDRPASLTFALHPALTPRLQSGNARLVELPQGTDDHDSETPRPPGSAARRYRLDLARGENRFTLRYGGRITDDPQGRDDVHTKSAGETGDIISPQGVLLSGASAWYPRIDGGMITFDLKVHLPAGWKSMSQGELLALPPDADGTPAEH
jgi:hypothetical protein